MLSIFAHRQLDAVLDSVTPEPMTIGRRADILSGRFQAGEETIAQAEREQDEERAVRSAILEFEERTSRRVRGFRA